MDETISDIGEFALIERIKKALPTTPSIVHGIGDDCAVVRIFDRLMAVSCDMSIEDVHFRRSQATPQQIGWKAAASSVSDLAAMGASPMFATVAMSCSAATPVHDIEKLYHGINSCLSRYGIFVIGGDTSTGEKLFLDITVMGTIRDEHYLLRTGARPGDKIAITGTPGVAAAGFHAMEHGHDAPTLAEAHFAPHPRIAEGQWLAMQEGVHAGIDISDGLLQDVGHIAEASGIGADVFTREIPIDSTLANYATIHSCDALQFAMFGGEDYELAFALDAENAHAIVDAFQAEFRTPINIIGEFSDDFEGLRINGEPAKESGFQHFQSR